MADKQDFVDLVNEALDAAAALYDDALVQEERDAWTNVSGHLTQAKDIVTSIPAPTDTPPTTDPSMPGTDTTVVGDTTPADPTGSGGDTSATSSTAEPGSTPDPTNS